MSDQFDALASGLTSPAKSASAVTPNDGADLTTTARSLYIGTGGSVSVILAADSAAQTFVNVPSGSILPVRAKRVNATGTTASNILALI